MPTTSNFGWTTPADTDLVKDGALAIRTLGNGIDTTLVDLKGGTTGQVLSKTSNTDMDFTWVTSDDANAIQNAIVDAKGDLICATAADTPARLAVGTNGQVLTADSTTATGLKWAAAAGGGSFTKITSGSFSSISSLDIDSLFSSTYKRYMLILSGDGSGNAGDDILLRMRHGSTTITSADYYGGGYDINRNNTSTTFGNSASTSKIIANDLGKFLLTIYFTQVGNSSQVCYFAGSGMSGSEQRTGHFSGLCNVAQTYTGINISTSAGNITGDYQVYGLGN